MVKQFLAIKLSDYIQDATSATDSTPEQVQFSNKSSDASPIDQVHQIINFYHHLLFCNMKLNYQQLQGLFEASFTKVYITCAALFTPDFMFMTAFGMNCGSTQTQIHRLHIEAYKYIKNTYFFIYLYINYAYWLLMSGNRKWGLKIL